MVRSTETAFAPVDSRRAGWSEGGKPVSISVMCSSNPARLAVFGEARSNCSSCYLVPVRKTRWRAGSDRKSATYAMAHCRLEETHPLALPTRLCRCLYRIALFSAPDEKSVAGSSVPPRRERASAAVNSVNAQPDHPVRPRQNLSFHGVCRRENFVAGAPGFEPGYGGINIRCLPAWLRPIRRRTIAVGPPAINGAAAIC